MNCKQIKKCINYYIEQEYKNYISYNEQIITDYSQWYDDEPIIFDEEKLIFKTEETGETVPFEAIHTEHLFFSDDDVLYQTGYIEGMKYALRLIKDFQTDGIDKNGKLLNHD